MAAIHADFGVVIADECRWVSGERVYSGGIGSALIDTESELFILQTVAIVSTIVEERDGE